MDVSTEDLSADFASFLELARRGEPVVIVDGYRSPPTNLAKSALKSSVETSMAQR
jgi:hypothetical protein